AIIVFIGVEAALLWVVLRYRRSRQPSGYMPPQVHGHTGLEIGWTIAPLIIVLAIAAYSFVELQKDFQPISNQEMTVKVSGHQFGWDYDYLNGVVVHQEGSLAAEVTPFVVPTNTSVQLQYDSNDVIHSWAVRWISGKRDADPGYDNFRWLQVDKPGKRGGECAHLRTDHSPTALAAEHETRRCRDLQPAHLGARRDDDVILRHDLRYRHRQLHGAAHDRRAGHGIPAGEPARFLADHGRDPPVLLRL